MIGTTLGNYQIIEQIGAGGMATVFKAYDPDADRFVAIKTLPPDFSKDPEFVERFRREARAIARLEHLHILPMFAYGEQEGIAYIVMRYLPVGSLSDRIRQGAMDLPKASRLLGQLASALDYAHSQGVIHRDVKPSNALLDQNDNLYLTDFGIAKMVESGLHDLTGDNIVGTPQYMSPEQCRGEKDLTPASDVYALGVVLYEMLTGKQPFVAETPLAVIHMQLTSPLPSPRTLRPDLPEAVEAVLFKALEKDVEYRYASCGALAAAFAAAVATAVKDAPAVRNTLHPEEGTLLLTEQPLLPDTEKKPINAPTALQPESTTTPKAAHRGEVAAAEDEQPRPGAHRDRRRLVIAGAALAGTILALLVIVGIGTALAPPPADPTPQIAAVRDNVTLHAAPDDDSADVTALDTGDTLPITGISEDGDFYQVRLPEGGSAWVTASTTLVTTAGDLSRVPVILPPVAIALDNVDRLSTTRLGDPDRLTVMALSPDEQTLVLRQGDTDLVLWDITANAARRTFTGHTDAVTSVSFNPEGSAFVSGSADNTVRFWSVDDDAALREIDLDQPVHEVRLSADGETLAVVLEDDTLRLYDSGTANRIDDEQFNRKVAAIDFNPQRAFLMVSDEDGSLWHWDLRSNEITAVIDGRFGYRSAAIDYSPTENLLAALHSDGTIGLWDTSSAPNMMIQQNAIRSDYDFTAQLAFSSDGDLLAVTNGTTTIDLWDVSALEIVKTLEVADVVPAAPQFSADGTLFAARGVDLWQVLR